MLATFSTLDWFPLLLSMQAAGVATLLALIAGVALGWLFARRSFPGSGLLEAACMLPLVLPPTVVGYGLLVLGLVGAPTLATVAPRLARPLPAEPSEASSKAMITGPFGSDTAT